MHLRTASIALLTSTLALSVACKKDKKAEQPFEEAVTLMCASPQQVKDLPADQKATKLAKWIDEKVTNEEAKKLFTSFGSMVPTEKVSAMDAAAKKAGLASCELAELWKTNAARTATGGGTTQHGSGTGGGQGGGGSDKSGDQDGTKGTAPKAAGTTKEHGTGGGAGAGPGGKGKASGNKDGVAGGASTAHGTGAGGGVGPGGKGKASGNKDGVRGGATKEHGSGTGGGAGPGGKAKAGDKDGKPSK